MKQKTKLYLQEKAMIILDRVMKKDFPDLNTYKISQFWIDFTEKMLDFTSTIVLILTFTWYAKDFWHLQFETIIIVLLCLILMQVTKQNDK